MSQYSYEGTTTFQYIRNGYQRFWSGGAHFHAHPLDLTVVDQNGVAVPNAEVVISHSANKEFCYFRTEADGKIYDCFGDLPVFVEKEETANDAFDSWTDGTQTHRAFVSKDGYQLGEVRFKMTGSKTITVSLTPQLGPKII